ncbi:glycosyltransferase [Chloroflexota bacterium]
MIFATVGHLSLGFERLVKKLDEIAPEISEEIIVQVGYTKYQPQNLQFFPFKPYEDVLQMMKEARVVVCHGGGVVIDVLTLGKPLIVVPRFEKYNEHIDDHQVILAERLKAEGKVEIVYDVDDLKGFLVQSYLGKEAIARDNKLISYLRNQVKNMLGCCGY